MKTSLEVRPPLPALPQEVLLQIVGHVADDAQRDDSYDVQRTLWACGWVNRAWYQTSIWALYRYPRLTSRNYDAFVRTVCPSINAHIKKTDLAAMVKVLDLSQLVFAGTKSFVARLLGRLKGTLEELKAPQTSFAVNSLAALSKCRRLQVLDMSLVTESIPVLQFFHAIERLDSLRELYLPRSSFLYPAPAERPGTRERVRASAWPPNLRFLSLPRGIARVLSFHGPEELRGLHTLRLHEVEGDAWDPDFCETVQPDSVQELIIDAPQGRVAEYFWMPGVENDIFRHFNRLQVLHMRHFADFENFAYTFDQFDRDSAAAGTSDHNLAAWRSLEELVVGPVGPYMPSYLFRQESRLGLVDGLAIGPAFRRLILIMDLPGFAKTRKLAEFPRAWDHAWQRRRGERRPRLNGSGNDPPPDDGDHGDEEAGEEEEEELTGLFWTDPHRRLYSDLRSPTSPDLSLFRFDDVL